MKKSRIIILAAILFLIAWCVFIDAGICLPEGRWLKKQDLVDRALFDQKSLGMSLQEKMKYVEGNYGSRYPELCTVNDKPTNLTNFDYFLNLIVGRKIFEIDCLSIDEKDKDLKEPAYRHFTSVDSCASKIIDTSGFSITKEFYLSQLKRNQTYWQENKQ